MDPRPPLIVPLQDALSALTAAGETYLERLSKAGFDVGLYRPGEIDPQGPHQSDEVYVIAAGEGVFMRDGEETPFAPGDLLFVPAGTDHRFTRYTPGFAAWVIFFGPKPGRKGALGVSGETPEPR
jgi:gentisate 1,2-dioxygenase